MANVRIAILVISSLLFVVNSFETENVANVQIEFHIVAEEDFTSDVCTMAEDGITIQETIKEVQEVLQNKAMIYFGFAIPDEIEKLRKEGNLRLNQLEILVGREEGPEMKIKPTSCDMRQEILRVLSTVFKEDLTYFSPTQSSSSCSLETTLHETLSAARDAETPSLEEVGRLLLPLSDHVFREFTDTGDQNSPPVFVAFWSREQPESVQLVRILGKISKEADMRLQIGTLYCPSVMKVCREQQVDVDHDLPVLIAYKGENKKYKRYEGPIEETLIADWMKMLRDPVLFEITEPIMPYFRSGILPNSTFGSERRDAVTIGFFANDELPEYKSYVTLANELHGEYHFGVLVHPDIAKWAHNPALATFKETEMFEKADSMYEKMDIDSMRDFVIESSRLTVSEINARTVASIDGRGKPLVTLVDTEPSSTKLRTSLHSLASRKTNREQFTFAYIQASAQNEYAKKLIHAWQLRTKLLPAIVILQSPQCIPTVKYPDEAISEESLLEWIHSNTNKAAGSSEGKKEDTTDSMKMKEAKTEL